MTGEASQASQQNVVDINVVPKTIKDRYRSIEYTVTFIPEIGHWKWELIYVPPMYFSSSEQHRDSAIKAVRDQIDALLGPQAA